MLCIEYVVSINIFMYLTYAVCLCFSSVFPQFRLQGDNMAERPEDVSMVSQTSEPAMSDSDGK